MSDRFKTQREQRHLGSLTALEVEAMVSADSVLCLPIGAHEQHGPHLPINTDTILAEGFALEVIERWGSQYDIWLLPTIPYGPSPEHLWSAGTVSLSIGSFSEIVLSTCESVAAAVSAKNLMVINGHGGNRGILEALGYEVQKRAGLNMCVTHPTSLSKVRCDSALPEIHGGMSETSVMLALTESSVHMDRLPESDVARAPNPESIRKLILDRGTTWPWTSDDPSIAYHGIIGDASKANLDLGLRIVESAIEEYGKVLSCLVERRGASSA
ncbi:MAG TPA: creatininase family protein [Pyrinomonadaceae bacterium]|nr:creatininase family protein [Pyrinomonadaceae bacterium]